MLGRAPDGAVEEPGDAVEVARVEPLGVCVHERGYGLDRATLDSATFGSAGWCQTHALLKRSW